MNIEYDPIKNERNISLRYLSFANVEAFDFETARYCVDERYDYNEVRIRAIGLMGARLHVLVFVEITAGIRVISFRKANKREEKMYVENS